MEEQQLNVWMVSVPYEVHTCLCLSIVPSGLDGECTTRGTHTFVS